MGYILHKGTTGRRGGEAYEAADRGIKTLCSGRWGREQSDMGCLAMTGGILSHALQRLRQSATSGLWFLLAMTGKGRLERAGLEAVSDADRGGEDTVE